MLFSDKYIAQLALFWWQTKTKKTFSNPNLTKADDISTPYVSIPLENTKH